MACPQVTPEAPSSRGFSAGETRRGRDRPWVVVVNRRAGGRGRALRAVESVLREAGVPVRVCVPGDREEGERMAREHANRDVVVGVLGGDGTVNLIGSQLVGGNAWLAVLPGGRGNLVCRSAGTPARPAAAVRHLLDAPPRRWDVGSLGGHRFIGIAGVGFDGAVCARAEGKWKQIVGQPVYGFAALAELAARPALFSARWKTGSLSRVHQIVVGNVHMYALKGLRVNPDAVPTDGLLNVAVFGWRGAALRPLQFLSVMPVPGAGLLPGPDRAAVTELVVEAPGDLPAEVDGEPITVRNPVIAVEPAALWVLQR